MEQVSEDQIVEAIKEFKAKGIGDQTEVAYELRRRGWAWRYGVGITRCDISEIACKHGLSRKKPQRTSGSDRPSAKTIMPKDVNSAERVRMAVAAADLDDEPAELRLKLVKKLLNHRGV